MVIELIVNQIVFGNRGQFSSNRIVLIDLLQIVIEVSNRIIVIEFSGAFCYRPWGWSAFGRPFGHANIGLSAANGTKWWWVDKSGFFLKTNSFNSTA